MEMSIHACDVSQQGRDFSIVKEWTYLLFEEFFQQGDLELEKGLPISMLCDRTTTSIFACQPGFIDFVPLPLFTSLSNIMPGLSEMVDCMKQNKKKWQ